MVVVTLLIHGLHNHLVLAILLPIIRLSPGSFQYDNDHFTHEFLLYDLLER